MIDYPNIRPSAGDTIHTENGSVIEIVDRAPQPNNRDTFVVWYDDERREMHIDELSDLLSQNTFWYVRSE